jgi:hypothetical protein
MKRSFLFSRAVQATGVLLLALAVLVICSPARSVPLKPDPTPDGKQFHKRLLEIARLYEAYGRVDDEFRWAPYLCRGPMPGIARFSASKDTKTHGQKLYSLLASNRAKYLALPKEGQPVGQVVVKQSWLPKEVDALKEPQRPVVHLRGAFLPYAQKAGRLYKADRQGLLFVMYKADPKTRDTDNGWVYGTVTPDGKTVTSAGRVASCMKCHQKAEHDRLFGLSKSAPLPAKIRIRVNQ